MAKVEDYILAAEKTEGKPQRRKVLRRKRGNEDLTREQVKAIKKGRKLLRKELRKQGLKSREDFEVVATSQGLYFDKSRFLTFWWMKGLGIWALLGATAALIGVLFLYAMVTQLQGHFTINMSTGMFKEGFVLADNRAFDNATTQLFSVPAENVPCVSISHIPATINDIDGSHNEAYFAYTFYLRNEGESEVSYEWTLRLNSESHALTQAVWVMIFEDDQMSIYAQPDKEGNPQALPAFGDNSVGYIHLPVQDFCKYPEEQFEVIPGRHNDYYRVIPYDFETEIIVATGARDNIIPMDVHKYTIVIWLEGDDPDCTDDLIGGHCGMDLQFRLTGEEDEDGGNKTFSTAWEDLWDNLIFWDD